MDSSVTKTERPETLAKAKDHINQIRNNAGTDNEPSSTNNLHNALEQSLKLIAEGLYQQSTRFLLELLQNADDCSYGNQTPRMNLSYWHGRLLVEYNELGFTNRDVEAICTVSTTKGRSSDQTGEKGVGFKSVFKVADVVWVFSGKYSFQFDATRKLGMITPQWADFPRDALPGFTSILLQLRTDCNTEELLKEMRSMSSKHLLFLRRLRQIKITIHGQGDDETWETTISREDGPCLSGSRLTTTRLIEKEKEQIYWIYQHEVVLSHSEPKRAHCTESSVTLAFPVCRTRKYEKDSVEYVAEPMVEEQDVYAMLPIRNYGFKFLINADFLLIANREDIVSSSDWNKTLRDSIVDAFQGAVGQLNTQSLRYTWPRYLPTLDYLYFFQGVGSKMKDMLLHDEYLESIHGAPVKALSARYVPKSMRDSRNLPLALGHRTESKYLSLRYDDAGWSCLQQLGVRELSKTEFLEDLKILIHDKKRTGQDFEDWRDFEEWHAQVAKVLDHFCRDDDKSREVVKDLPLIPLADGRWVSASTGNIFFPNTEGPPFPDGIGVLFVDSRATENEHRKLLFQTLGVQLLSIRKIQDLIMEALSQPDASEMPDQNVVIAYTKFLFQTKWSSNSTKDSAWVVSEVGAYLRAKEVYLDTMESYSFGEYFEEFRKRYHFLHPKYLEAAKPEEQGRWFEWIRKELGVRDASELVPKLQGLTVDKWSGMDTPSRDVLIKHTVFLFRTKWTSSNTPRLFWFITDTGKCVRAREVYYDSERIHSRRYFKRFRGDLPFLHADYYSAVKADELDLWLNWLRESLGVWDVPRLVDDSDPKSLSQDFQRIMKTWPSREFLMLLKEEWGRYGPYFDQQAKNIEGKTGHKSSTPSARLREKLRSAVVSCSGGSFRPLCDTSTISVFLETEFPSDAFPQFILDIADPHDAGWGFLEIFGVTIKDDVKIYLQYLDLERTRGSNASKSFVTYLYGKIQEKADENTEVVREAFKKDCIFIPRANMTSIWVKEGECVWDGGRVLKRFHELKGLYSQCEKLFTKILTHTHMDFEVLASELESISPSTPLSLIIELFKEVSTRHVSRISSSEADRLRSNKIFPVDEGNATPGFDDLCSGLQESEWYIADRPQYRTGFRGVVSLLSFSPWDVLTVMPLIKALGFENRLLSKRAVPDMRISTDAEQDKEQTELFRAKTKFISRMMPNSLARHKGILKALNTMEVFVSSEVFVEWAMTSTDSRLAGQMIKSQHYDHGTQAVVLPPTKERGIRLFLRPESRSHLPFETATELADICGIGEQAHLVYFVFSHPSLSYIEEYLDRQDTSQGPHEYPYGEIDELDDIGERIVSKTAVSHLENDTGKKEEIAQIVTIGEPNEPPRLPTKLGQVVQRDVVLNNVGTSTHSYLHLDHEQEVLRPGYASLSDQFEHGPVVLPPNHDKQMSSGQVESASFRPVQALANPRIVGKPHVTFISDPQELPTEDYSENPPGGNVFPSRAQISQSGSCNIIVATRPDTQSDLEVEFAGELLVSKLLEQHLGTAYHPETHWTSHLRTRADHTPLSQPADITASFTLENVPAVTEFLLRSAFHEAMWWLPSCPMYYIQVQTTVGGQDTPFVISATNLDRARRYRIQGPWPSLPYEVFILVRVAGLHTTTPTAFFYIDPYKMYASGEMRVRPERNFFSAQIQRPRPQIALGDFGCNQLSATILGPKSGLGCPASWVACLWNIKRRISSLAHGYQDDEIYAYQPLVGRTIRLLELFPGNDLDVLEGELRDVPLDNTHSYQAISYAWGFGIKPFVLKTSVGIIGITASLCFGLRRVRQKQGSILVWADAICIDQRNMEEKSSQILFMPNIFQAAKQVVVWIGPEANGSNHAIECFRRMAVWAKTKDHQPPVIPDDSAIWNSIDSFFKRPWFQRAWIAQELVLATQAIVMCGKESVLWDDIYAAAEVCFQQSRKSSTGVTKHMGGNLSGVLSLGDLRLSYHKREDSDRRQLLTLFQRFHHSKATLQRDKLFALLGLANDAHDPNLNPDYDSPLPHVVRRYAEVFVRRGNEIELLYHAGLSSSRFPSWIPDWITNTPKQTISTWTNSSHGFSACTSFIRDIKVSPDDSSVLIAKGYVFDSIETVGKMSYGKAGCLSYLKDLSDLISQLPSYPSRESLGSIKWKIPIGGLLETTSSIGEEVDLRAAYQALSEYLELGERHVDWKTEVMQIRALGKIKHFLFRPEELRKLLWPYLCTAIEFAERFVDAKACVTRQGYVGIVPGTALPGDTVVMIYGSAVPFLARKSESRPSHYNHLGETYIHGIMHGSPTLVEDRTVEDIRLV